MALRRAVLTRLGRLPALQDYVDNRLTVGVRITFSKYLSLLTTGQATRQGVAEFHRALGAHPELFAEWLSGLRLQAPGPSLAEAEALADELLALAERELARIGA